jgi:latrophilin 1
MKAAINTPSTTIQDVYVTPMTGSPACQPKTARQLQWNWTPAGQVALQPCPIGATGLARWYCSDEEEALEANGRPQWQGLTPDMSDCKSVAMTNLESQVRQEDPENVLVSSLAYLTRTKSLYGGDLEAAVSIMRIVASRIQYRLQSSASFHDKVNHIRQVLLNVLRSTANILEDGPNREAWRDLSPDRQMKVATSLMLALEENAFLLAGVTETPEEILETYETLSKSTILIQTLDISFF